MQPVLYRKINELLDSYRSNPVGSKEHWVKRLFKTLDWGTYPTYSIASDGTLGYKLLVDNFAMVNVLTESPDRLESVYQALNKAYNQDVPWVIATDFQSLGIFGSYWMSFPHEISGAQALRIDADSYLTESHHLELLTPQSVASNKLNEFYAAYKTRRLRLPIDVHLVNRMAQWRQLGLDAIGGKDTKADSLIHKIINSFFLLRYIEDTSKRQVRTLMSIAESPNDKEFFLYLRQLLRDLETKTGYKVPANNELSRLGYGPIRRLIRELYGYPEYGVQYDFSDLTVDILGRFYEEYLRMNVTRTTKKPKEPSLFGDRAFELEDVRRRHGVYYTPRYIVDYILNSLLQRYRASNPTVLPIVTDLSCGSGAFLSATLDHLLRIYPSSRMNPARIIKSIVGFDNDPRATEAARLNLTAKLISHGFAALGNNLNIICVDIIQEGPNHSKIKNKLPKNGPDIIVGNPPYIHYEQLSKSYDIDRISKLFEAVGRRIDSYILFVEAALRLTTPGGFVGLVLPSAILRTRTASTLREFLSKQADLLEIIDFQDQRVFQGVGAYVCLLLFRKRIQNVQSPRVVVAKVYSLSRTPSTQLASATTSGAQCEGVEVFQIDQPKGAAPWLLKNQMETLLSEKLASCSDNLAKEILALRQGIKDRK